MPRKTDRWWCRCMTSKRWRTNDVIILHHIEALRRTKGDVTAHGSATTNNWWRHRARKRCDEQLMTSHYRAACGSLTVILGRSLLRRFAFAFAFIRYGAHLRTNHNTNRSSHLLSHYDSNLQICRLLQLSIVTRHIRINCFMAHMRLATGKTRILQTHNVTYMQRLHEDSTSRQFVRRYELVMQKANTRRKTVPNRNFWSRASEKYARFKQNTSEQWALLVWYDLQFWWTAFDLQEPVILKLHLIINESLFILCRAFHLIHYIATPKNWCLVLQTVRTWVPYDCEDTVSCYRSVQ